MRSSVLKIVAAAASLLILWLPYHAIAEDYLIIKKKSGSTQKIPLNFPPDQIDSLQVESGPRGAAPAERETEAQPEAGRPAGPETAPPSRPPETTTGPRPPETAPTRRPAAEAAAVLGPSFTVNVYQLPENANALPDFSTLTPKKVLKSDVVNLDPAKGIKEPEGLPDNYEGMGLRFIGVFSVKGEGIFRWRIQSKDGVRFHIDDKTIIENDGIHETSSKTGFIHLAEGIHSVILDSFNAKGYPFLKLFVQPPIGPEKLFDIPNGLAGWQEPAKPYDVLWGQVYFVPKGEYPKGPDFSKLSPIGRLIAPELSISSGPIPGLPGRTDMVGIRYQGFFNVSGAGIFAFRLLADTYAKLTIGNHVITEAKSTKDGRGSIGWAFLQEGSYPIGVDFFHGVGDLKLELYVTQPEKEEELFAPAKVVTGYASDSGKLSLIPAFVYFLEPNTRKLPNFNKMTPAGMFYTKAIDYPLERGTREFPGVPKRADWLGLRFYVKFSLTEQEAGAYKFRVVCKDAARLIIGKKLVINAEGQGKVLDQSGTVELQPGSHEMFLDYLQTTGPNCLQLYITPPGGEEKIFAFQ